MEKTLIEVQILKPGRIEKMQEGGKKKEKKKKEEQSPTGKNSFPVEYAAKSISMKNLASR